MPISIKKLDLPEIDFTEVWKQYKLFESSGEEWRYQMAEDEDFFLGNQLTDSQKEYLESVGQPPEANNKIRPAVETVLANIAAASPEWDVRPIGKTDNDMAFVCNQMLDWVWRESDGDIQFRKACKDFIIKGLAYFYVYPDWNADGGEGGVRFKRISPESVFIDPNSMLPDFSDASSILFSDLHTKEALKAVFPQYKKEIEDAREEEDVNEVGSGKYSRDQVWTRDDVSKDHQKMVRKYIHFTKVNVPKVLVTDTNTGKSQKFEKDAYKELIEDARYKTLVEQNVIIEELVYDQKIREVALFGDQLIYDEDLPISKFLLEKTDFLISSGVLPLISRFISFASFKRSLSLKTLPLFVIFLLGSPSFNLLLDTLSRVNGIPPKALNPFLFKNSANSASDPVTTGLKFFNSFLKFLSSKKFIFFFLTVSFLKVSLSGL